ncbi:MAG: hypothetical protein A3B62_02365 [Rhodospirillales bacterium RIFCSPLOWO2_01_FULL_65_14]|nr:MAG: hypothetical protein A3B62_02365 [Rhodospirillales bacterium RIFCSPLOWO2_01_FULL_65_14]
MPKSTPVAIRKKLSDMIGKINSDPAFIKKMEEGGFAMVDYSYGVSNDKFQEQIAKEITAAGKEAGMIK